MGQAREGQRAEGRLRATSTYFHTQVIQKSSERRTLFPSPLAGEGDRAEAKPSEVGRGVISVENFYRKAQPAILAQVEWRNMHRYCVLRARLVARTAACLEDLDLQGLSPVTIREGTVGADARALGGAALPLIERFGG